MCAVLRARMTSASALHGCSLRHNQRIHTKLVTDNVNKLVGFYSPTAPPVPNAPSSDPRNDADATFVNLHICRRLPLHDASTAAARYDRREVAEMTDFKIYLLRHFCSNRAEFF